MSNPFKNPFVRDWYIENTETYQIGVQDAITLGSGPFEEQEFDDFLTTQGITPNTPTDEVETVVVGLNDWDKTALLQMLSLRSGKSLKVYSQEMFLAYLTTGVDPFAGGRDLLAEFAEGHPALEFLVNNGFDWPSTFVPLTSKGGGLFADWPEEGFLGWLGYHVGKKNPSASLRRIILTRAFIEELPIGLSKNYSLEWGTPKSSKRLQKTANCIASFARSAKRRLSSRMNLAVSHWESDLAWLKKTYYETKGFRFQWPDTWV